MELPNSSITYFESLLYIVIRWPLLNQRLHSLAAMQSFTSLPNSVLCQPFFLAKVCKYKLEHIKNPK